MREVDSASVELDGTLAGSASCNPNRGVTFLSSRQWQTVMRKLGADLPWHTRRANVLIDADALGELRGRRIQIGQAEFEIVGETRPCELMDQFQQGLKDALKPDCRAGVHGRVTKPGLIRLGDAVVEVGAVPERSPHHPKSE
jgi:MOSC domain-containing protein YiiM